MAQQGGQSSKTILWILLLLWCLCNMVIGLIQYQSNIVLFFAEFLSGLIGILLSALQILPDLLTPLQNINIFRWTRSLGRNKLISLMSFILLLSFSLNILLYINSRSSTLPVIPRPKASSVSGNTSPIVLPSPSQQGNPSPATSSPYSHTYDENKLINCTVNCNGDTILSVNYIATDPMSVYNQTWDLTITNGNLKPCGLELTRLVLRDVNTNDPFEGRSPVTNSGPPWELGIISGRGTINEDPYFSNVQPTGTFILYVTIAISCQDGVGLSEQYQSDGISI